MKKQGVLFFVLRTLACQLQNQADFLFSLVGEEKRPLPQKQPGTQNGTAIQQATAREQRLNNAEMETLPVHWPAPGETGEPPAHWVKLVQQAKPTSFAAGVKASRSSALPARPAEIKTRRADSRLIALPPGMPASPSTDHWNDIQELPSEPSLVETAEIETPPLAAESASDPAFHPGKARNEALASLTDEQENDPISPASPVPEMPVKNNSSIYNLKKISPPAPYTLLAGRHASTIAPRQINANRWTSEEVSSACLLPAPQSGIALNIMPAESGEQQVLTPDLGNQEKALSSLTKEPGQQSGKLAIGVQRAPSFDQKAEDIPAVGKTQGILPVTMSSQQYTREEQELKNSVKISEWASVVDGYTRPLQDRWPDPPMRPDLLPEKRECNAGNAKPASYLSWKETGMVIPTGTSLSTARSDQGNQAEEGWPSLPDENPRSSQDWRMMHQAWEHQQRLDDEQRGNEWNAQLFY